MVGWSCCTGTAYASRSMCSLAVQYLRSCRSAVVARLLLGACSPVGRDQDLLPSAFQATTACQERSQRMKTVRGCPVDTAALPCSAAHASCQGALPPCRGRQLFPAVPFGGAAHMRLHRACCCFPNRTPADIRLPFFARGPGVPRGLVLPHLVGNVDLAPTW